jgi:putative iron-dependent peroxidase
MAQPQRGILPEPNESAFFVACKVRNPRKNGKHVARTAATIPALVDDVGALDPSAELVCTVSFGAEFWDIVSPGKKPAALRPFHALNVEGRSAPSTGGDLFLHLISRRTDLNMETVLRAMRRFDDRIEVTDEVHGFRYLDSRDLTGFIDGTENPSGDAERAGAALIGDEDAEFAGGSYVFAQRYVHNLRDWTELPVDEQERIIGRRKPDSEELPEDLKPATAHISRVVIEENGEELEILRHSFPYGSATEAGLFFIAYTKDLSIPERMLARMLGAGDDHLHDHLMHHTQAVTGATFFAPSLELLTSLA